MLSSRSDLELIAEFKAGNFQAFSELISRYEDKAFSLAQRLTRSPEDAEEVLQDAFTTVFRKIDGFEGKSSFSSWFYRVTVNAALMRLRKRRQDRSVLLEDIAIQAEQSALLSARDAREIDHTVYIGQLRQALYQAIQRLPEDYRNVFVLRDVDGLTSEETGKILGLSIPAVKSRLHRARLILRRRLAQLYREFGGQLVDKSVENL